MERRIPNKVCGAFYEKGANMDTFKIYELRRIPHDSRPPYFAHSGDTLLECVVATHQPDKQVIEVRPYDDEMNPSKWTVYVDHVAKYRIVMHTGQIIEKPEALT